MAALTLTGMNKDVERFLHDHPVGRTTGELSKRFKCSRCKMKKILAFLNRNKMVKHLKEDVWKHTNWLRDE